MAREINKIRAEGLAWRLTQDYCINKAGQTPVEDIAMDRGILCIEAPLTGCLARLVRKGKQGLIRTKAGIREEGRKRFAVAHELGHWFMHEKESQGPIFACTAEQMRDYKGSPPEVEANLFASELLMPSFLFKPLAETASPSLKIVKKLAGTFGTSLTATGIKFVDLNHYECALVLSTRGKVVWSKQKGERTGLRIEKGMPLHEGSLAKYLEPKDEAGPSPVEPEAWISQNWHERQLDITEESWAMDDYDSILTLLVIADNDERREVDMIEHYERKARGVRD